MKTAIAFAIACAALVPTAGIAAAAPTADMAAPDVVQQLTDQGYSVQINGAGGTPLSQCTVTGVHGQPADPHSAALQFTTVYVDVKCDAEG